MHDEQEESTAIPLAGKGSVRCGFLQGGFRTFLIKKREHTSNKFLTCDFLFNLFGNIYNRIRKSM